MEKISLKAARINAGMSQAELADILGVHRNTIASLEKEPEKMTIKLAKKICEVLDVDIDHIFFNSNLQNVDK